MVSSKGKPTDPELRESIKEDIKDQPVSKDGGGKGQWAAWKGAKLSKEYEAQGGDYENEAGTKNEPKKGAPEPKSDGKKDEEVKDAEQNGDANAAGEDAGKGAEKEKAKTTKGGKKGAAAAAPAEKKAGGEEKKSAGRGRPPKAAGGGGATKTKEKKEPAQGTRRSERVSKREADTQDGGAGKKQKK